MKAELVAIEAEMQAIEKHKKRKEAALRETVEKNKLDDIKLNNRIQPSKLKLPTCFKHSSNIITTTSQLRYTPTAIVTEN